MPSVAAHSLRVSGAAGADMRLRRTKAPFLGNPGSVRQSHFLLAHYETGIQAL